MYKVELLLVLVLSLEALSVAVADTENDITSPACHCLVTSCVALKFVSVCVN